MFTTVKRTSPGNTPLHTSPSKTHPKIEQALFVQDEQNPSQKIEAQINKCIKEIIRPKVDTFIDTGKKVDIKKLTNEITDYVHKKLTNEITDYVHNELKYVNKNEIGKIVTANREEILNQINNYLNYKLAKHNRNTEHAQMQSATQPALATSTTMVNAHNPQKSSMNQVINMTSTIFANTTRNIKHTVKEVANTLETLRLSSISLSQFTLSSRKLFGQLREVNNARFITVLNNILLSNKMRKVTINDTKLPLTKLSTQQQTFQLKHVENALSDNLKHLFDKVETIEQLLFIIKDTTVSGDITEFKQNIQKYLTTDLTSRLIDEILSPATENYPQYNAIEVIFFIKYVVNSNNFNMLSLLKCFSKFNYLEVSILDELVPQDWFNSDTPQIANQTVADYILESIIRENSSASSNVQSERWIRILTSLLQKSVRFPEIICDNTQLKRIEASEFKKICQQSTSDQLFHPIIYQIRENSSSIESKFYLRVLGKNYSLKLTQSTHYSIDKKIYHNHAIEYIDYYMSNSIVNATFGIIKFQISNTLSDLIKIIKNNDMENIIPITENSSTNTTTIKFNSKKFSRNKTRTIINNLINGIENARSNMKNQFDALIENEPDPVKQQTLKSIKEKILTKLNELNTTSKLLQTYVASTYDLQADNKDLDTKTVFQSLPVEIQKILSEDIENQYKFSLADCLTSEESEFMQKYIKEIKTNLKKNFDIYSYFTFLHNNFSIDFINHFIENRLENIFAANRKDKIAIFVAYIINKLYDHYNRTKDQNILTYIKSMLSSVETKILHEEMESIKLLIGNSLCKKLGIKISQFSKDLIEEVSLESANT